MNKGKNNIASRELDRLMSSEITKTRNTQLEAEFPEPIEELSHAAANPQPIKTAQQNCFSTSTCQPWPETKEPLMSSTTLRDFVGPKNPSDDIYILTTYTPKFPDQKATNLSVVITPRESPYPSRRPSFHCSPTRQRFPYITLIPPHYLPTTITLSPTFRCLYPDSYTAYQLHYRFRSATLPLPFSFHVLLSGTRIGGHGINVKEKDDIYGRVPLTKLVFERLGSLGKEAVFPWLRSSHGLRWIFEQDISEAGPVELEELKGVRVRVATTKVNININIDELEDPKWTFYECVTEGTEVSSFGRQ